MINRNGLEMSAVKQEQVDGILTTGLYLPEKSEWASPVLFDLKKYGNPLL